MPSLVQGPSPHAVALRYNGALSAPARQPMSRSFSPRSVPTNAWKLWHKDAARLCLRLGWTWGVLWCIGVPAMALLLTRALPPGLGWLLCLLALQIASVLCQPIFQHALDRAAAGHAPAAMDDAALAVAEITENRRWFVGRSLGQVVAFISMMAIAAVLTLMSGPSDEPKTTGEAQHALTMLLFFVLTPIVFRAGGILSFHYWLRVRHRIEASVASKLHSNADLLNPGVLWWGVLSLAGLFYVASHLDFIALVLFAALQLYHAAYVRCAYHDIFEGGTGVEAKVAQAVLTPASALQA